MTCATLEINRPLNWRSHAALRPSPFYSQTNAGQNPGHPRAVPFPSPDPPHPPQTAVTMANVLGNTFENKVRTASG